MKQCVRCLKLKVEEAFAWKYKQLGVRHKHCRACMNQFNRSYYQRNKEKIRTRINQAKAARQKEARQYVWNYLAAHPCVDCGETDPRLLEFDHIDAAANSENVSELAKGNYSMKTLKQEIAQCVVRCVSCHRKKTYQERGWFRG